MTTPAIRLAEALLEKLRNDLLGEGSEYEVVEQDFPHNLFPAGNLGPAQDRSDPTDDFRATEFSPSAVGMILQVPPGARGSLRIKGTFNVFFPTAPTIDDLRRQASIYEGPEFRDLNWGNLTAEQVARLRGLSVKYRPIYRRRRVSFATSLSLSSLAIDNAHHAISDAAQSVRTELAATEEEARTGRPLPLKGVGARTVDEVSGEALADPSVLDAELGRYNTLLVPSWDVEVLYRAWQRPGSPNLLLEILLANRIAKEEADRLTKSGLETHLFAPRLSIEADEADLLPFELAAIREKDYRNRSSVLGSGVNCDLEEGSSETALTISTDIVPVFRQKRLESTRLPGYEYGAPTFEELDDSPLDHLKRVGAAMREYARWWESAYLDLVEAGAVPTGVESEYMAALSDFRGDLARYEEAVRLLGEPIHSDLLQAFRLTNRSFAAQKRPELKGWRLFQLIFLVSNMGDFLHRESPGTHPYPAPCVLAFPTGGGKTEAYLGLILTHAFWDRLRGKSFGLTAWCKFPLRLLGMQQLSRFLTAFAFADIVRSGAPEIPHSSRGDSFGVGLFAGGENSTNDTDFPNDASRGTKYSRELEDLPTILPGQDHRLLHKNRKIDICPLCKTRGRTIPGRMSVRFDPTRPGFIHFCQECGYEPPLFVTDTEVRRFLPTVVIGTIDKLAELGRDASTKILFGFARSRCATHGYFEQPAGTCQVLGCGGPTQDVSSTPDLGPGLLIQDELHLLRETLGAFDSHYETASLAILDEAQRTTFRSAGRWKIIGSSATIAGFDDQIRELYALLDSRRFPSPGPARGRSFYATETEDEVQRYIVGFRPHSMSHVDAVMKVLLSYHRTVLPLANHVESAWVALGEPFASMSLADREDIIRRYRTSLSYAMTRMEAAQINRSFTGQLNPTLARESLPTFEDSRVVNLSSESGAEGIQGVLYKLESPPKEWIQALTSTSIVGHGVDIDVLNFIVFRGQPHTVAEWVQAMARVGRKPGYSSLVVNVYNPNRERDATYYRHHKKFIEHADSLLRTVPITRYSSAALRKTFPGLFYNTLAFFVAPAGFAYDLREQVKRSMPKFRGASEALLRKYYALPDSGGSPKEVRLREALEREMESTLQILNNPHMPQRTVEALRPMTSLRDVDELVSITPDYDFDRFG
jgi:hypothetical protein